MPLLLVGVLLVSGCTAYRPRPIDPAALATVRAAARLDPDAVARRLAVLSPGAAWNRHDWDRLALFAAAIEGNPAIAAARAAVATAAAAARAARVRQGPTLTLTGEYARNAPEKSPWLFGGVLDVPVETGGRRTARLAGIDLGVIAARQDYAETVWSVRMALRRAVTDRLLADRQMRLFDAITGLRQRQFAAMQRRVDAGAASRAELERVRADGADAVRRRADAATLSTTADAAIAAALGVPASAIAGLVLVWEDFDKPAPAFASDDASVRSAAVAVRADVLKAVVAYDSSEADLRGEVAKQYPAINIAPGYTWERGLVKLPLAIGLVLPPLDGNRSAIAAAAARRTEAGAKLETSIAAAQSEIDRALVGVRQTRQLLLKLRLGEGPAALRLAVQADREIAAGSIDRTEWAAAQSGARLTEASELEALARVHAADAALEDALRRAVSGPELQMTRTGARKAGI